MSYLDLPIREIHQALVEKRVTPLELTQEALKRAKASKENAFEMLLEEEALSFAATLTEPEEDNLLWGIPYLAKDNFSTKGIPTTGSSNILLGYKPLFDAAVIDGASAYKILWRVYFPQATASVATLFIIGFMNNWNDLLRPLLYLNKARLYTVTIGLTRFQTEYTSSWALLLTASVLSVLPLIIVYIFCQRYIIENQMSAGVKG